MEKKNKVLFMITILLIIIVSIVTYYSIFISHNYVITFEVPCDPNLESCFVVGCDSTQSEDCKTNSSDYYKLIERKASDVMKCGSENFECLVCKESEINCNVILCDPQDVESICSNL